jgi:erythronate-4-phosphate dehydrogenase
VSALKIVCDRNLVGIEPLLKGVGEMALYDGRAIDKDAVSDADALLVRSITPVNEELLSGTPVKFVGTATAGFDHFDCGWLDSAGITWANAPGCNANSVVEYVLAAILATDDYWDRLQRGGALGIVGYGHVGRLLAQRARALGVTVCVNDPWLDEAAITDWQPLDTVLRSDVVSLHASLVYDAPWPSYHLLNAERLALVSNSSLLINASRGPVAEDAALLARLEQGNGPATILDVWETEPVVNTRLLAAVRLGTAHIAGHSYDAKLNGTQQIVAAMRQSFGLVSAGTGEALNEVPVIKVPEGLGRSDALRHALRQTYHIEEDDRALREALRAPKQEHVVAFDRLRREYPRRRELAGSTLQGNVQDPSTGWLAEAFGCAVEEIAGG